MPPQFHELTVTDVEKTICTTKNEYRARNASYIGSSDKLQTPRRAACTLQKGAGEDVRACAKAIGCLAARKIHFASPWWVGSE